MAFGGLHADRARAESFGSIAQQYERLRPGYPRELIDDLVALLPDRVLDVGCGTGKAAVALANRGLRVLGVELDARMATIAHDHGIPVEVASFENWDDVGRRFDLIVSGQAWHWVDPARGVDKAARLLRRGGTIACFWNYTQLDEPEFSALRSLYRDRPAKPHPNASKHAAEADPFESSVAFADVVTKTYSWERVYSSEEWVSLVSTHSDHLRLPPGELAALQRELHATIERLGGRLHTRGGTYAVFGRREA